MFDGDWTLKNPLNAPAKGETTIPRPLPLVDLGDRPVGRTSVRFLRDEVFPFFAEVAGGSAVNFMHGARLVIDEPTVLTQVVGLVDGLAWTDRTPTPRATCSSMCSARSSRPASWASSARPATSSAPSSR
jgi:hypothetical protein